MGRGIIRMSVTNSYGGSATDPRIDPLKERLQNCMTWQSTGNKDKNFKNSNACHQNNREKDSKTIFFNTVASTQLQWISDEILAFCVDVVMLNLSKQGQMFDLTVV
ncbi:hypothetical protein ROHU_026513 [Labeo rohita]|uniref:Uncharacterized protein n=1 Tax=Labeo rohita TaxID=84645 RepID=A0A498MA44_LABRO|nr:hypothetical protein ROHU_009095 [Labeo rohita]RXN17909.1 hypothetical protein ROHU_026513 [Labeo rohita]